MHYRADIDGLRAIAVVPVVFYHADVGPFPGGFVGVDVFFVISGYLITSLIAEEIRQGRFSLANFYERRIRRIFPALFSVMLFSSIMASVLLTPAELKQYGQSVVAGSLFSSNVLFWLTGGYFDTAADTKPLLHTWSLSVEEQFYIVFPIVLLVVFRWLRGRWALVLIPAMLSSFCLSVYGATHHPSATFYLAPTRAWELLLGSVLALRLVPPIHWQPPREIASIAGIVLIVWSMLAFSNHTIFPGLNAVPPCAGAALLIYACSGGSSVIGRVLSSPAIVFVGLISYSLYLWHWPLIVFFKHYNLENPTQGERLLIIVVSLFAAFLTWQFIERPFRAKHHVSKRGVVFGGATLVTASWIGFGLFGHLSQGWPQRIPPEVLRLASGPIPGLPGCMAGENSWIGPENACTYGADVNPEYAVWGDSHAQSMIDELGLTAKERRAAIKFFGYSGCPPILGVKIELRPAHKCAEYNNKAIAIIEASPTINTVFLIARHAVYLNGWTDDFGPAERGGGPVLVTNLEGTVTESGERKSVYAAALRSTAERLFSSGKKVVLVYPFPETGYHIPNTLTKLAMLGRNFADFSRPYQYFRHRNKFVFEVLDGIGTPQQVIRVYPHQKLCDEAKCIVYADGKALYFDDDHLSADGAKFVSSIFDTVLEKPKAAGMREAKQTGLETVRNNEAGYPETR